MILNVEKNAANAVKFAATGKSSERYLFRAKLQTP